jgi:hypothetical protein
MREPACDVSQVYKLSPVLSHWTSTLDVPFNRLDMDRSACPCCQVSRLKPEELTLLWCTYTWHPVCSVARFDVPSM